MGCESIYRYGAYARYSEVYPLGADYVGRDLYSRILYGGQVSLRVAFIGPIISLLIGVTYGSISGFLGGKVDTFMMRIVDIMYAFPGLLFIILLMAFFRGTFSNPDPGSFTYVVSQLDQQMVVCCSSSLVSGLPPGRRWPA